MPPSGGALALNSLDDVALRERIDRGDEGALEEVCRRYEGLVYRIARTVGGPDQAAAVAEQVFVDLWLDCAPGSADVARRGQSLRHTLVTSSYATATNGAGREGVAALDVAICLALVGICGCTVREAANALDASEREVRRQLLLSMQALRDPSPSTPAAPSETDSGFPDHH